MPRSTDLDELVTLIRQESHLHHPDLYPLHPRARLRVHPLVVYELMKLFLPDNFIDNPRASSYMGIPVIVNATMEPGTWQFIIGEGKIDGLGGTRTS